MHARHSPRLSSKIMSGLGDGQSEFSLLYKSVFIHLEFKGRGHHSAPVIGDSLYLWAGTQLAYDSKVVETFSLSSGFCSSHLARGIPPLGVAGYSCTTFRSNIYYYAGWVNYDDCYYNSLNALNTLSMSWTQLHPNDESMMKKAYGGMLSLEFDRTDYLFMVGGYGPIPPVKHPQFQYEQIQDRLVRTNEQLLYNLSNSEFELLHYYLYLRHYSNCTCQCHHICF